MTRLRRSSTGGGGAELVQKRAGGLLEELPLALGGGTSDAGRAIGQVPICWDPDEDTATKRAHDQFRWFGGGWAVNADLPTPAGFAAASRFVTPDDVADSIPCGPDLDAIVDAVSAYWQAGFTDIAIVQVGDEVEPAFLGGPCVAHQLARSRLLGHQGVPETRHGLPVTTRLWHRPRSVMCWSDYVHHELDTPPLRWAGDALGGNVVEARPLSGGITSAMLALTTANGARAVLRLMTNEPWRTHGAALTRREHEVQLMLAGTEVPAPRTIALDADGSQTGEAAHLMTLLPGRVDEVRVDDDYLRALATTLAMIHELRPAQRPRTYQSWAVPAKRVVPDWAAEPAAWRQAFAMVEQDPPAYEGTFIHRDYQPRNVLWTGPDLTGVVDWVETSWGPAWLDVAHTRTHLAFTHGTRVAERFAESYAGLTGREPAPYWDVLDLVGWLPSPSRVAIVSDPRQQVRLEEHLLTLL